MHPAGFSTGYARLVSVIVTLVVTIAVILVAVALVAGRYLFLTVRRLRGAIDTAQSRLQPLADELEAEAAVANAEIERVQAAAAALAEQRGKHRGRR